MQRSEYKYTTLSNPLKFITLPNPLKFKLAEQAIWEEH